MNNIFATPKAVLIALLIASVGIGLLYYGCADKTRDPVSTQGKTGNEAPSSNPVTGNGAPSGPHYDLNFIGVPKGKTADMTGDNGHRIFVNLYGNTKILLSPGDFQVLDANGTDGLASFQLPNPDLNNTGTTIYSVWARALGKPGGSSVTHLCWTDSNGITFCSGDSMLLVRTTGKSSFTNVTKELLYIFVDINGDGVVDRVPLFDSRLKDYFWSYDNTGLKLAQLRF